MNKPHLYAIGLLCRVALATGVAAAVSGAAIAQDIRGELVRISDPRTLVVDVKGQERTIVSNPTGSPGVRATLISVEARCTLDALPKGGLVVFRGKLDWSNFYEIDATELRLELGDKPVDSYMEGSIQSKGKLIGSYTSAFPARSGAPGRTAAPGGVATRELHEDATLEIAGYVVSTKPLVVQVTLEGMTSVYATINNKALAAQKVAGAKFKVALKGGDEAIARVELGRAVHLAGDRPRVNVWLDKATGAATQVTLIRKELIEAENLKAPATKKATVATKKAKPDKKKE